MRIVVIGKRGQLVQALLERGPAFSATLLPIGRPELDLGRNKLRTGLFSSAWPDLIISTEQEWGPFWGPSQMPLTNNAIKAARSRPQIHKLFDGK